MLLGVLQAQLPLRAVATTLYYGSTFIVMYLIIYHAIVVCGTKLPTAIIAYTGIAAAIVGISEKLLNYKLPLYTYYESAFSNIMGYGEYTKWERASGTLGNPIIYAAALTFTMPFIYMHFRFVKRVVFNSIILIAISLTLSRSALMALAVLICGIFVMERKRHLFIIPLSLLAVLIGVYVLYSNEYFYKQIIEPWRDRVGNYADDASYMNYKIRLDLMSAAWEQSNLGGKEMLIGFGTGKSAILAENTTGASPTLDNTYITVLYELGYVGLCLFVLIWMHVLYINRTLAFKSIHYYSIIGWIMLGFGFTHIYYATCNVGIIASIAILQYTVTNKMHYKH